MAWDHETNWYLLTGTTCSGKTSVAEELRGRGHLVVPEVTRAVFSALLRRGVSRRHLETHEGVVRKLVFDFVKRLHLELLPASDTRIFFDRGFHDQIAFLQAAKLPIDEVLRTAKLFRYRGVFHFEPLDFVADGIRTENEERRFTIHESLRRISTDLGYAPTFIPKMSISARADLVLDNTHASNGHTDPKYVEARLQRLMEEIEALQPQSVGLK